jgi:hypothetical protein
MKSNFLKLFLPDPVYIVIGFATITVIELFGLPAEGGLASTPLAV